MLWGVGGAYVVLAVLVFCFGGSALVLLGKERLLFPPQKNKNTRLLPAFLIGVPQSRSDREEFT